MREVNDNDKLFYFEKNFFTLDGLWMIEVEKEVGWEKSLKIDKAVWERLMKIVFKRLKKYLKINTNNLKDFIEILTFRWSIEGWNYSVFQDSELEAVIEINKCPYKAIMDRNPERKEKIPLICKNMCIPFYKSILKDFNSQIKLERKKFMGLGDKLCNFHLTQLVK